MSSKAPQGKHSSSAGAMKIRGGVMPNNSHVGSQMPKPMKSGGRGPC